VEALSPKPFRWEARGRHWQSLVFGSLLYMGPMKVITVNGSQDMTGYYPRARLRSFLQLMELTYGSEPAGQMKGPNDRACQAATSNEVIVGYYLGAAAAPGYLGAAAAPGAKPSACAAAAAASLAPPCPANHGLHGRLPPDRFRAPQALVT
jgi:hypothetical protein